MMVFVIQGTAKQVCATLRAMLSRYGNIPIKEMLVGR
jgi:hypothetical protein